MYGVVCMKFSCDRQFGIYYNGWTLYMKFKFDLFLHLIHSSYFYGWNVHGIWQRVQILPSFFNVFFCEVAYAVYAIFWRSLFWHANVTQSSTASNICVSNVLASLDRDPHCTWSLDGWQVQQRNAANGFGHHRTLPLLPNSSGETPHHRGNPTRGQ